MLVNLCKWLKNCYFPGSFRLPLATGGPFQLFCWPTSVTSGATVCALSCPSWRTSPGSTASWAGTKPLPRWELAVVWPLLPLGWFAPRVGGKTANLTCNGWVECLSLFCEAMEHLFQPQMLFYNPLLASMFRYPKCICEWGCDDVFLSNKTNVKVHFQSRSPFSVLFGCGTFRAWL